MNVHFLKFSSGNTALLDAVHTQDYSKVKILLERGADINAVNNGGDTALHIAALLSNESIVKVSGPI